MLKRSNQNTDADLKLTTLNSQMKSFIAVFRKVRGYGTFKRIIGNIYSNKADKPLAFTCLVYFGIFVPNYTRAQTTQLEHASSSYVGTVPAGPATSYQKARFVNNSSGQTFTGYNPDITVTAWLSDQQFNNTGGVSNLKGIFFGGTNNEITKTVAAQPVWKALNTTSGPADNLFTSSPTGSAGTGISADINYGFNLFTNVEPLFSANKNKGERFYYGKLTVKYNRAVSNPVLHLVGLGGSTSVNDDILGYSTELELDNTPDIELQLLSGNSAFKVENNKILNGKSAINDLSSDGAATGSVKVKGTNITTITFKVYLRGDGKGSVWSTPNAFKGDQWLLGFSMNTPAISGNVYDDGNALSDLKVNPVPKGTNIDNKLRVNLVRAGTLISSADVGEDGAYVFQDVTASSYPSVNKLVLTAGDHADVSKLPKGWVQTGENLGAPTISGNDNLSDGKLEVTLANASEEITNANFGVNKLPASDAVNAVERPNPGANKQVKVPSLAGTDLEDGDYTGDGTDIVRINSLPNPGLGVLFYNNLAVVQGQLITGYDPLKLTVDPVDGAVTVTFTYSHKDAAGSFSEPAEVSIPFYPTYQIGGNVLNDENGMLGTAPNDNKVDGPGVKRSDLTGSASDMPVLFVSVVFNKAILATTAVTESGRFQFDETFEPRSYDVVLHVSEAGSHSAALPGRWVNTGENTGNTYGCDGNADGTLRCALISGSALNLKFGINKIPEAFQKAKIITAPGKDQLFTLDGSGMAPALSGFDLEDKTLGGSGSKVVITELPSNGKIYYNDQEITTVNTQIADNFNPALVKMKLSGGSYSSTEFSYAFIDQAGALGTDAQYLMTWDSPLPVRLGTLKAAQNEQILSIVWTTASESNSSRFEVEHSINGKAWQIIGKILASGDTGSPSSYSFDHMSPVTGQNLYRLKMVDNDESFSMSRIISARFENDTKITLFPNPATEYFMINTGTSNAAASITETTIFDLNGRAVFTDRSGASRVSLQGFRAGIYAVKIREAQGIVSTYKIIVKN